MHTKKSYPDIAILILRISIGISVLVSLPSIFQTIQGASALNGAITLVLGLILVAIAVGFYSRWLALVMCVYYLFLGIFSITQYPTLDIVLNLFSTIVPYIVIALIGSGIYSVDHYLSSQKHSR